MEDKKNKGQEEMVGFALIILLVAVILLVFLGFTLNKAPKEDLKSSEVENFLNAALSYTTECRDERNFEFLSIRKLIKECSQESSCYNGKTSCDILESDLKEITEKSWDLARYKGYEMKIVSQNKSLIPAINRGNLSGNNKGYLEDVNDIEVRFRVYY